MGCWQRCPHQQSAFRWLFVFSRGPHRALALKQRGGEGLERRGGELGSAAIRDPDLVPSRSSQPGPSSRPIPQTTVGLGPVRREGERGGVCMGAACCVGELQLLSSVCEAPLHRGALGAMEAAACQRCMEEEDLTEGQSNSKSGNALVRTLAKNNQNEELGWRRRSLQKGKTKALALDTAQEPHERGEQLERKRGPKRQRRN